MSFFRKRILAERIYNEKCHYCSQKKRDSFRIAEYKIRQPEDKTIFLCTKCYKKYEKIHDVLLKKVVDFSDKPLNLPEESWLVEMKSHWKSFREFGSEKYLDFRKDPGWDAIFFILLFEDYKKLSDDEKKEFQISYKISQYAPSIPMVILDWENDIKIGFSHEGEIICKIFPNEDILLFHKE